MIKCLKSSRVAIERVKVDGKHLQFRRKLQIFTKSIFHSIPTADAFASIGRLRVASHPCRLENISQLKSADLLFQRRHASDDGLISHAGLKRTALHELHLRHGGTMVPFGGYSMPVHYSDLGVGESHKWTREKASLFDVGHM